MFNFYFAGVSSQGALQKYAGQRHLKLLILEETSLLCRLQAQTLPDATPQIGKISPCTKMAVTFEPVMRF